MVSNKKSGVCQDCEGPCSKGSLRCLKCAVKHSEKEKHFGDPSPEEIYGTLCPMIRETWTDTREQQADQLTDHSTVEITHAKPVTDGRVLPIKNQPLI